MGPIDYSAGQTPPQDFLKNLQGGLQLGAGIRQIQQVQAQQQLAQQQAAQYQSDIASAYSNPTPQAFAALALKYPQQREAVKQAWDGLSEGDRKAEGDTMAQAYSALLAGKPDVAKQVVQSQIQARKNSGLDTSHYDNALTLLDGDPKQALGALGFTLSHINDPKAFGSQFGALGNEQRAAAEAPIDLRTKTAGATKAEAEAIKAGADATVAQATIPEQIAKPASELATAQQKRRLDEFDALIRGADSETKRGQLILEREKYVAEQAKTAGNAGAEQQTQLDSVQQAINTTQKLLADPELKSSVGVGSIIGKALSFIPGTDSKDYRANIQTLKAQLFLPAVAALKAAGAGGALSDAEGKKLDAQIGALDPDMSPKAFETNLRVVLSSLQKAQQKVLANSKTPTQGGGFVTSHPVYGQVREGDINRLMKQYPGATREQVMTFLNQGGAK